MVLCALQEIHDRIMSLDYQDCKVYVSNVDSQSSAEGGIIVQVLGEMSNQGQRWRKFAQTFFLAEQPTGYFVLNDIFRYLKEDADEQDLSEAEPDQSPSLPLAQQTAPPEPSPIGLHQQQQQHPAQGGAEFGYPQPPMQYPHMAAGGYVPAMTPAMAPYPASQQQDQAYAMSAMSQQPQPAPQLVQPVQQPVDPVPAQPNGYHPAGQHNNMPEVAVSERSASPSHAHEPAQGASYAPAPLSPVPQASHQPEEPEATPIASEQAAPGVVEPVASSSAPAAPVEAASNEPVASTSAPEPSAAATTTASPLASESAPAGATSPAPSSSSAVPPSGSSQQGSSSRSGGPKTTSWANLASRTPAPTNARGLAAFTSPTQASTQLPSPVASQNQTAPQPSSQQSPSASSQQPLQHVPLAGSSTQSVLPPIGERHGPGGKPFRNVCDPNRTVTYTLAQVQPNCFLKNILENVDAQEVRQTLQKRFGSIRELDLMPDKGCGFVEFNSVDQARKACQACLPVHMGGSGYISLQKSGWPIVVEPKVHKPKTGGSSASGAAGNSGSSSGANSSNARAPKSSAGGSQSQQDASSTSAPSSSDRSRRQQGSQQGGGSSSNNAKRNNRQSSAGGKQQQGGK